MDLFPRLFAHLVSDEGSSCQNYYYLRHLNLLVLDRKCPLIV